MIDGWWWLAYGCFRVNLMITVVNSRLIYGDAWLLMFFSVRIELASPAEWKDFHKTFVCIYMTIVSPRLTTWWLHWHSGCLHLRIMIRTTCSRCPWFPSLPPAPKGSSRASEVCTASTRRHREYVAASWRSLWWAMELRYVTVSGY